MLVAEGPPSAPESCRPGPPLPPAETTPGRSREVIRVSLPCHMAAGAQTSSAGPCQDRHSRFVRHAAPAGRWVGGNGAWARVARSRWPADRAVPGYRRGGPESSPRSCACSSPYSVSATSRRGQRRLHAVDSPPPLPHVRYRGGVTWVTACCRGRRAPSRVLAWTRCAVTWRPLLVRTRSVGTGRHGCSALEPQRCRAFRPPQC
jgi:hypothetical protein